MKRNQGRPCGSRDLDSSRYTHSRTIKKMQYTHIWQYGMQNNPTYNLVKSRSPLVKKKTTLSSVRQCFDFRSHSDAHWRWSDFIMQRLTYTIIGEEIQLIANPALNQPVDNPSWMTVIAWDSASEEMTTGSIKCLKPPRYRHHLVEIKKDGRSTKSAQPGKGKLDSIASNGELPPVFIIPRSIWDHYPISSSISITICVNVYGGCEEMVA